MIKSTRKERPPEVEYIGGSVYVRKNIVYIEEPREGRQPPRKGWGWDDEKVYTEAEWESLQLKLAIVELAERRQG